MKKFFTLTCIFSLLLSVSAWAQTDITPARYKFNTLPVGPFSFDKQFGASNVPISDPDVLPYNPETGVGSWNDGFYVMSNGTFTESLEINGGNAAILNSAFQIFDMGGEVGKVLMMKGSNSSFPHGTPASAAYNPGWVDISVFTDPSKTPSIAAMLPEGVTGETATAQQKAEATKKATVRLRIVFHIHENTIGTNPLFKIIGYTYTNNAKGGGEGEASELFGSSDFQTMNLDPENFGLYYDDTKWVACEYDMVAPENAGTPLRFTLKFGDYGWGNLPNYTVLIKEISMISNPTGEAVGYDNLTLVANPVATAIGDQPTVDALNCYGSNGELVITNAEVNEQVEVYALSGQLISSRCAGQAHVRIPLAKGLYIVRVGTRTAKVAVQ